MLFCILELDSNREIRGWIIAAGYRDAFHKANHAAVGCSKDSPQFQLAKLLRAFADSAPEPKPGKSTLPTGHVMLVG